MNSEKRRTALVIMAAGIGARFGGGIKQLAPVGPCGEIIMDYSIHDAIEAGFNKIVFIIRKDIEKDFREVIGNRIEEVCRKADVEVAYTFQSLEDLPEGVTVPEGRTKPWGTGQAVLCCRDIIKEPFAVINADDYYGKQAYIRLHDFLQEYSPEEPYRFCMAGFILKNTLSDNGGVTRGICRVNENGFLEDVVETHDIVKTAQGAEADGVPVDTGSHVSMNMWGLTPEFMGLLEEGFTSFFRDISGKELKAEYLLPTYIGELLREKKVTVEMLETTDKWFGVTYKDDKPAVMEAFKKLIADGVYREDLFSDM
ncbi:hypothetical protein BRYFOR_07735 [Marvinbryantia formatexigens DSM 14469]|uniref:Nucleotidyl transferase domain-containing protein n=1 Tax=Marvinbryantia formatexigens DSM 14469 TaxID=478749 RepID=C6LGH5_9FIRM|nr:sugar phosphate nucleotidyltransferase [Marvinbryantia formatexigens]EET60175.1 hypothetical protein BRYFOR_07735 [Marvinbryantia formatexigens DSM 14469]UWO24203.1 sugar phosphate nucleotidyltransferase [Marvinbryantia formatexigens DSM 14469]SDF59847.1 Nucleotidyl transferase [Marvinbryantia formatexigens]